MGDLVARVTFHAWLDRVLASAPAHGVVAFVLHLYEGTSTFDAQLAATTRFDPADPAWACEQAWSTGEDLYRWERTHADDSWELALQRFTDLMREYLASGAHAEILRRAPVVAIGFVDGDLTLIPSAAPAP